MRPRIESIAARLLAATHNEVRRQDDCEGTRLEVDLPAQMTELQRKEVLSALADADAYGHERTSAGDYAWAYIGPEVRHEHT